MNEKQKSNRLISYLKKEHLLGKALAGLLILAAIVAVIIGIKKVAFSENQTTKIGFENIGELATQSSYCTQVNVTDSSKKLFGASIPFTNSKYIYSYGITIKAGYDFNEIDWNEKGNIIEVKLPEVKILSSEIDQDSFKVYHEDESVFNQVTLEENNEALTKLKEQAQTDAIESGLFENARDNAETILTSFFGNVYDLNEYEIVFKDK
ncbi:DUF4230 domain-containing protein [Claveliimonas sp.]|uniref:DUF4230 domain-containing protein n=2 Tax=Claveliimonas TaxID=3076670 RepID=UPI00307B292C